MKEIKQRLKKLAFLEDRIDGISIFSFEPFIDPNFFYLTNSNTEGIFYYDFNKPVIYTFEMEFRRAKKSWVKDVRLLKNIDDIQKMFKGKTIGIDTENISAKMLNYIKTRYKDVSNELANARAIKTKHEIECIKESCSITKKIYRKVLPEISGKMTERELKGLIEFIMSKHNVEPAFPTIVASGKNIVFPHHTPAEKKLTKPILIDMGIRYKGYCSDFSRTTGSSLENVIDTVIENVEQNIKPGIRAGELEKLARRLLGKQSKYFIHSLGHGIGICTHEAPRISQKSMDVLKPGMTFTIEPGIYKKGGLRVENDYLLTDSSLCKLT